MMNNIKRTAIVTLLGAAAIFAGIFTAKGSAYAADKCVDNERTTQNTNTLSMPSATHISQLKQPHKADIEPHWFEMVDENGTVYDGIKSADPNVSSIKDVDGGFTIDVKFYGEDEYNTGVVNDMKPCYK